MKEWLYSMQGAFLLTIILTLFAGGPCRASVVVNKTRIIYNEGDESVPFLIANTGKDAPVLAQMWIEDTQGNKLAHTHFAVTPHLHRLEPLAQTAVRLLALNHGEFIQRLPRDRESLFYLMVREIPQRSEDPSVIQIAVQNQIKVFYRPQLLIRKSLYSEDSPQSQLQIFRTPQGLRFMNPTPYHVVIGFVGLSVRTTFKELEGRLILPYQSYEYPMTLTHDSLVWAYIDDLGNLRPAFLSCAVVVERCESVPMTTMDALTHPEDAVSYP